MRRSTALVALCALFALPVAAGIDLPMEAPEMPMEPGGPGFTSRDGGELAIGQTQVALLAPRDSLEFAVQVDSAGLLTVGAFGPTGDLALAILDADYQPLPDGEVDGDLLGNTANERLCVALPWADTWRVAIRNIGDAEVTAQVVAGFVGFAALAKEPDPDGRPSKARVLSLAQNVDDHLDPAAGDHADWYAVEVAQDGRLLVFTGGDGALDLALFAVTGERYDSQLGTSDQDLAGNTASEGLILPVTAGQTILLRVLSPYGTAGGYKLGTHFVAF